MITAQTSRVPTLVFDEADVGIGGPTAETLASYCAASGARQVLTVTHLPYAAQGHHHHRVPRSRGDGTRTAVAELDQNAASREPRECSAAST